MVILFLSFITPFSYNYAFESYGFTLNLPGEPIMMIILFMLLIKYLMFLRHEKAFLFHPLTIAIIFNLFWIAVTAASSTMHLVSFKFLFSRLLYTGIFFFLGYHFFKEIKYQKTFIWLFSIALATTIILILSKHSQYFFAQHWSNKVTSPFFKDHTVYGAVIALFLPFMFGFTLKSKSLGLSNYHKVLAFVLSLILIIGIIFSYSRAAWVSVLTAFSVFTLLLLGFRFRHFVILAAFVGLVLVLFWTSIMMSLGRTQSVSSTDFKAHFESISNVSTDVSNTERINRWNCAVRMFKEKPLLGWGPGTYMFKYAPFQRYRERTPISTNFGDVGNAHSEYLGPLSESGLPGMLSFIAIALILVSKGIFLYYNARNKQIKLMALMILLSLTSYLAHGVMNNFLHTDKTSVPFWALMGMMVALDINNKNEIEEKSPNDEN